MPHTALPTTLAVDITVDGLKTTLKTLLEYHTTELSAGRPGLKDACALFRPFLSNIDSTTNMPTDPTLHPSREPDINLPATLRGNDTMLAAALALASTSTVYKAPHDKCDRCSVKAEVSKPVGDECIIWLNTDGRNVRFSGICTSCLVLRGGNVRKAGKICSLHGMSAPGQQREIAIEVEDDAKQEPTAEEHDNAPFDLDIQEV
ncbi:hypothetical protein BFW01_g12012 [Lasiodiplodia theobromae]|nr:hypothetical protein BFW01_g12012 [Lasiodiplodia theobromae]